MCSRKGYGSFMAYRTHNCNELTFDNLNEKVTLAGWVDTIRDHGGVAFIDLRDEHGVTQVVVNDDTLIYHLKKKALFPLRALLLSATPKRLIKACNGRA